MARARDRASDLHYCPEPAKLLDVPGRVGERVAVSPTNAIEGLGREASDHVRHAAPITSLSDVKRLIGGMVMPRYGGGVCKARRNKILPGI